MSFITIQDVHKSFYGKEILKGINLTIEKGEVIVILGPSGSGKTTFLRCLNTLEKADRGQIRIDEVKNSDGVSRTCFVPKYDGFTKCN